MLGKQSVEVITIIKNLQLSIDDFYLRERHVNQLVFKWHEGLQNSNTLNSFCIILGGNASYIHHRSGSCTRPSSSRKWVFAESPHERQEKHFQAQMKNCLLIQASWSGFTLFTDTKLQRRIFHISLGFYSFDDKLTLCHLEVASTMP